MGRGAATGMMEVRQPSDLLPNPDGCSLFEPQAWRPERCRSCGHSWTHHRGAIPEPVLRTFTQARAQSAQATATVEVRSREIARAKAEARRRQNQVDDWLFDGVANDASESEDEGFRMLDFRSQGQPSTSLRPSSTANTRSPVRVVNLIDFGECNVVSVTSSVSASLSPGPSVSQVPSASTSPARSAAWIMGANVANVTSDSTGNSSGSSGSRSSSSSSNSVSGGTRSSDAAERSSQDGVGGGSNASVHAADGSVANADTAIPAVGSGPDGRVGSSGSSGAAVVDNLDMPTGATIGTASSSSSSFCPSARAEPSSPQTLPASRADGTAVTSIFVEQARTMPVNDQAYTRVDSRVDVSVLHQEVEFLRQRLADANEEKKILVAIAQDEMFEVQCNNNNLKRRLAAFEASGKDGSDPFRDDLEASQKAQLDAMEGQRRQAESTAKALEERCQRSELALQATEDRCRHAMDAAQTLRTTLAAREGDLAWASHRLMRLGAPVEALEGVTTDEEVELWEKELLEHVGSAMKRLAERRIDLKAKTATTSAAMAQEIGICKICFDRPSSCALLPCRHHAFCVPCAQRVRRCREPLCPICRTKVTGMLETFSS